jgi:hypothetical protein
MSEDGESKRKPEGDYEVGYCKPPKASQFQKGRSGNPRGRRKNAKSLRTLLMEALDEKVTVNENGGNRKISKREAAAIQIANRVAMGDPTSLRFAAYLIGELEERQEQESVAAAKGGARARVTARIDALAARIRAYHGLGPDEPAPLSKFATIPKGPPTQESQ